MDYRLRKIGHHIIFIQWYRDAEPASIASWMQEVTVALASATQPVIFVTDMRKGKVKDIRALREMGRLTENPLFIAGISYGKALDAQIYVDTYDSLASRHKEGDIAHTVEQLVTFLERQIPGCCDGIDWQAILYPETSETS